MIRAALKAVLFLGIFGFSLYLFFFVPLGQRTLYEHIRRIAATDEAQDLRDDVGEAGGRIRDRMRDEL